MTLEEKGELENAPGNEQVLTELRFVIDKLSLVLDGTTKRLDRTIFFQLVFSTAGFVYLLSPELLTGQKVGGYPLDSKIIHIVVPFFLIGLFMQLGPTSYNFLLIRHHLEDCLGIYLELAGFNNPSEGSPSNLPRDLQKKLGNIQKHAENLFVPSSLFKYLFYTRKKQEETGEKVHYVFSSLLVLLISLSNALVLYFAWHFTPDIIWLKLSGILILVGIYFGYYYFLYHSLKHVLEVDWLTNLLRCWLPLSNVVVFALLMVLGWQECLLTGVAINAGK